MVVGRTMSRVTVSTVISEGVADEGARGMMRRGCLQYYTDRMTIEIVRILHDRPSRRIPLTPRAASSSMQVGYGKP